MAFHIGDALKYLSPANENAMEEQLGAAPFPRAGSMPFPPDSLFDFVFIDADKRQYPDYYRAVLPRVRPGGYILADNTLWDEHVLETLDKEHLDAKRSQTLGVQLFNDIVAADTTVEKVILPLRDGLTIVRVKNEKRKTKSEE